MYANINRKFHIKILKMSDLYENRMKIKLLTELFIPLDYKVRTMWENHVGVIGVEETLKIGEMIVF